MTFSIGPQELGDPATTPMSSGSLSLTGDRQSASVAAGVLERENVRWLEGTIQPVVWTEDTTKTGFYRVRSTSTEDTETFLSTGFFRWSAVLEPLPHYRALEVEATCRAVDRTNAPGGGVNPQPWYAIPSDAVAVNYATGSITTDTRTGPGGSVFLMTGDTAFDDRYARWTVGAGDYLDMAPRPKFSDVTIVGKQSTLSPFTCTLDNGLVKIGMATGSTTFQGTFPGATPSSWGTPFGFSLGSWDGISTFTAIDPDDCYRAVVTRLDAEVVSVRWSFESQGIITHIDTHLRRGAVVCEIVCSQESAYTNRQWGINQASTTTVHSSRANRSSTIEDNYYFTLSDRACTKDSGTLYIDTAADQARFGMGVILDGGSATSENDGGSVRDQFFSAQMITERFSGVRQ